MVAPSFGDWEKNDGEIWTLLEVMVNYYYNLMISLLAGGGVYFYHGKIPESAIAGAILDFWPRERTSLGREKNSGGERGKGRERMVFLPG